MILGRDSCRWAATRLPLLAGGDLTGLERRRTERHVLACPSCRDRLSAHESALSALRGLGAASADAGGQSPSLWPALARQLRESRHEPPVPWTVRLVRARGRLAAGLAAGLLLAAGSYGAWTLAHRYIMRINIEITDTAEPSGRITRVTVGRPASRPPVVRSTFRRPIADVPPEPVPTPRAESGSLARGPQPGDPDARPVEPTN